MVVYIASDHRGLELKQKLVEFMRNAKYDVRDLGPDHYDHEDDYPDFAARVAEKVSSDKDSRGIVICGSGGGVSIAANKYKGIRAVIGFNPDQAKATKVDEDTNVLALSSDFVPAEHSRDVAEAWLGAEFSGEDRHVRRLKKIIDLEK